jgi:hypothetical protein
LTAVSAAVYPVSLHNRLRVGVSGHRVPPKLPAQSEDPLRNTIDRLLSVIVDTVCQVENAGAIWPGDERVPNSERPFFRERVTGLAIVSSLAEGSDRIVAEAGLAASFELEVILPFGRADYADDFETLASRARFEHLLARASTVFELSGDAGERPPAYEAAGLFMLANIDLLIAIWDGKRAAGIGGTAQIVGRAMADGIPIMRIDPANPNAIQMSWREAGSLPMPYADVPLNSFRPADEATIALVIKQILSLPPRRSAYAS